MVNALAGEVEIVLNGKARVCKLTLGALAELETALGEGSVVGLIERFESGRYSGSDLLALVVAGLRGGGWTGSASDLMTAEIKGGLTEAARVAAEVLVRAFAVPK